MFVEHGYSATTISRIAGRVGISSTGLYVYFPDKNAILAEICDATFKSLIEELDGVQPKHSDPLQALQESLEGYIRFGLNHSHEYELVFLSRGTQELQRPELRNEKLGMQAFQRFCECVEAAVQAGLTRTDTERLAQQLWAGVHGLLSASFEAGLLLGRSRHADQRACHDAHPWSDKARIMVRDHFRIVDKSGACYPPANTNN